MGLWKNEFRVVYYNWEYDTLRSFYKDILRLKQEYAWYTSPVDRGCKFTIGNCRLELICRRPTTPQGCDGMRLEAVNIDGCYANLVKNPRVNLVRPIADHPWGERSFVIKDPVGNWVEVYQRLEDVPPPHPADDGAPYFTGTLTAILFARDLGRVSAFYRDALEMPCVHSWDNSAEDRGCRLQSADGFLDIRQMAGDTPQGPLLTTIEAVDVDVVYGKVVKRPGVELIWDMEDTWYGIRMFQVRDCENNMLEAISYRRNLIQR